MLQPEINAKSEEEQRTLSDRNIQMDARPKT